MAAFAASGANDGAAPANAPTPSITGSTGANLQTETTALALLAFARDREFLGATHAAYDWLAKRCSDGRFGATQATILALKAIIAFDALAATQRAPGTVTLRVGSWAAQTALDLSAATTLALGADALAALQAANQDGAGGGDVAVEVRLDGGFTLPYAVDVEYFTDKPASGNNCTVELTTRLARRARARATRWTCW